MAGSDGLSQADVNGLLRMSSSQSECDPWDRGQADGPESAGRRTIEHTKGKKAHRDGGAE